MASCHQALQWGWVALLVLEGASETDGASSVQADTHSRYLDGLRCLVQRPGWLLAGHSPALPS